MTWKLVNTKEGPYFLCLETGTIICFQRTVKLDIFEEHGEQREKWVYEVFHKTAEGGEFTHIGREKGEINEIISRWKEKLGALE